MGFLNSDHIQAFVTGQVVESLEEEKSGYRFCFANGESLLLFTSTRGCKCCETEIIATPYHANGEVKQSLTIKSQVGSEGGAVMTKSDTRTTKQETRREVAERIALEVGKICGHTWESCVAITAATADAIEAALKERD